MPPKQIAQLSSNDLTERNIAIIRAALCSLDDFKPNWPYVLHEFGLGKGGHGLRDFKNAIAKMDLELKDGKIFPTTDAQNHNDAPAAPNSTNNVHNETTVAIEKKKKSIKPRQVAITKRKKGEKFDDEDKGSDGSHKTKATKKIKTASDEDDI